MVEEHRIKKLGASKWFLIPYEYIKVYELDKFVYNLEVSKDGKTLTFRRMRKDKVYVKE